MKLREDIDEQSDDPNIGILAALTSKVADTEAHLMTLTEKLTTEEAKVSAAKEEAAKITAETEKVRHATMEEVTEMKAQAAKVYEASVEKAEESRNESNKLLHDAKEAIIKAEEEAEEIRAEAQKVRGCVIASCIHIRVIYSNSSIRSSASLSTRTLFARRLSSIGRKLHPTAPPSRPRQKHTLRRPRPLARPLKGRREK